MLGVQESSSQWSFGSIGIADLLLALALLALALGLVVGSGSGRCSHTLGDAVGGGGCGVHGGASSCDNRGWDLEAFDCALTAGDDGVGVLHVGAQEVIEAILDVGEASLEVGESDDDLLAGARVSGEYWGGVGERERELVLVLVLELGWALALAVRRCCHGRVCDAPRWEHCWKRA